MPGLYLYCIREKTNSRFSVKGIDGDRILTLPYKDLQAIVSQVSLGNFDPAEIKRKAQEDLKWIKAKAQIHEDVIEQAMGLRSNKLILVVPMQFGVIFDSIENLKKSLAIHYEQLQKSLKKLANKQEWGVKVFLKENIFRKIIENENKIISAKKKKIRSMPRGIAFFAQKQLERIINRKEARELDRVGGAIEARLNQLVFDKKRCKLLPKDFTGRPEEMILNIFYLIKESQLGQFRKRVKELRKGYRAQGLVIEMTGPWPAYHFT